MNLIDADLLKTEFEGNPNDTDFVRAVQENRRLESEKRECEALEYTLNARR